MQFRKSIMATLIAPILCLGAVGLVGCGKSSGASSGAALSSSDAAPSPDVQSAAPGPVSAATACSYISAAQLSSIEGASYAQPTIFNNQICTWIGSDGNAVSITLRPNAAEATWASVLAEIKADQTSDEPTPIPGLGDRAAGVGLEIAVQHATTIIDIRNGDSAASGKWPKSTAIANAIIAGLH